MNPTLNEWLNLALRWIHVFAGILWIGQTYFFTWLDGRLTDLQENAGQVWMVHSGGFYVVEKQKVAELSRKLHWFKYETLLTWITGILLLGVVYYMGGSVVDNDIHAMGLGTAAAYALLLIVGGWLVYDTLWMSPLGKNERVGAAICYFLLVGVIYGTTRIYASRAAYIHVGAMLGTIMTTNVWMRILPTQRKLIAAMKAGEKPDDTLAERAKQRSRHNTFMVMPVIFIMLSNHFPTATYGSEYNWIVLAVLVLVGWAAAKIVREHH